MVQRLLIVERYNKALHSPAVRRFEGEGSVAVIVDRRKVRRRRRSQMREMDRRQTDRRDRSQGSGGLRSQGFFWASRADDARARGQVAALHLPSTA